MTHTARRISVVMLSRSEPKLGMILGTCANDPVWKSTFEIPEMKVLNREIIKPRAPKIAPSARVF